MRNLRLWVLWVAALAVLVWYGLTDPDGGRETLQRVQWLAWLFVVAGPVYLFRRAFMPAARSHEAATKALEHPIGAGLVILAIAILTGMLFLAFAGRATAAGIPERAQAYLPVLDGQISSAFPKMPMRSVMGALIEQETCASKTKCWNPRTELKTSREYGFGLGQLTVAYKADGSERFNAWREIRAQDSGLAQWRWEDRFDAKMQLRALVVMERQCFYRIRILLSDDFNALAMCDAAYNGGYGGVLSDRRVCAQRAACDPNVWFANVESTSLKSREKWKGYGQSAFDINRTHVLNVMKVRRPKYAAWWREA